MFPHSFCIQKQPLAPTSTDGLLSLLPVGSWHHQSLCETVFATQTPNPTRFPDQSCLSLGPLTHRCDCFICNFNLCSIRQTVPTCQVLLIVPVVERLQPGALLNVTLPPKSSLKTYRRLMSPQKQDDGSITRFKSAQRMLKATGNLRKEHCTTHRFQVFDIWDMLRFVDFTQYLKDCRMASDAAKSAVEALFHDRKEVHPCGTDIYAHTHPSRVRPHLNPSLIANTYKC